MSTLKIFILILVIYSFCACKKDSNQQLDCPNYGYENGSEAVGSTGNYIYHFDSSDNNFSAIAAWTSSNNKTTVIINGPMLSDSSFDDEMIIQFYGKQTGTYSVIPYGQTGNPVSANQAIIWLSDPGLVSNTGTLTVAQYDSPGGKICGSFSGDFVIDTLHLNIINGAFSATVQ